MKNYLYYLLITVGLASGHYIAAMGDLPELEEFEEIKPEEEIEEFEKVITPVQAEAAVDLPFMELPRPLPSMQKKTWTMQDMQANFGNAVANEKDPYSYGIRRVDEFIPGNSKAGANPIVLFVLHGTGFFMGTKLAQGGQTTEDYYNPDAEGTAYNDILNFAQKYAAMRGASILVISYRWSGANDINQRRSVGYALGALLNKFKDYEIVALTHSHGGNVINVASHALVNNQISYLIELTPPVRETNYDEKEYEPTNFRNLISFYSTGDWVVPLGAYSGPGNYLTRFWNPETSLRKYADKPNRRVVNVRVLIDGQEPGHSFIKNIAPHLFDTIYALDNKFTFQVDMDMNIDTDPNENNPLIITIRHDIQELPRYEVMKKEYAQMGQFGQEMMKNTNQQIEKERKLSKEQEARFKNKYGTDIHAKALKTKQLLTPVWEYFWPASKEK